MARYTLWTLSLSVLLLSACQQDHEEADSARVQTSTPVAVPTMISVHPQAPRITTESLGITLDDEKIIIDTRQTKRFLHGIGEKMKNSLDKIEATLRKDKIGSLDETGIIITDTKMQIDLNKTRNFMEKWTRSMESVVNELNKTMEEIKRGLPQR